MSQRYEIREQIGKGGLGAVYKAFDTQLHREVAMKRVLTTEHATADEVKVAAEKLIGEAKTLSCLNHPNIVTVFDVGQDEKGGFVVMELLKGETLDETVARGVLTQEDFMEIVYQTMEALIAAQASNVLHRDLKPTNVMVIWQPSGKFQTKILDFGLAKFSRSPSVQTMDQEDAVMGSIFFMAPEQFERSELDARTDLYQIGCVYYHALTGQYPFRGETGPQVMNAHLQHRVTPLEKMRPDLSPSICKWVMWLISRKMEERPADARVALERFPRNPEPPPPPEAVPMAILVEDAPARVTTGVQVVLPTQSAKPPMAKMVTGPAPAAPRATRSPGQPPKKITGAVPAGKKHSTGTVRKPGSTEPVSTEEVPKNRKPLFIGIGAALLLAAIIAGWTAAKSAKAASESARIGELAAADSPSGSVADIDLAIRFLESKDATPEQKTQAAEVLGKLQGNGIETAITSSLTASASSYIRLKLAQAAAQRELTDAAPAVMTAFRSAASESQKAEFLTALRSIASEASVPILLDALKDNHSPGIRDSFEGIISAYYRRSPRDPGRIGELFNRIPKATEDERRSLYRILGTLGGDPVLGRLQTIFESGDTAAQKDGANALLAWPDRTALPVTEKALVGAKDEVLKILLARAYGRLTGLPSTVPLSQKIEAWKKGLTLIARQQDARRIFAGMAEHPGPETRAALQEYEKHPVFAPLAKQAIKQLDDYIKKAPVIPSGGSLIATAANVTGEEGAAVSYSAPTDALSHWRSPGAWFVWTFKVKEAGNYAIAVQQSFPFGGDSEFEVIVAEKSFAGKSIATPSSTVFAPVALPGTVTLEAGKVYYLVLAARGITQPRMMDVKGVNLTKQ